MMQLPFRHPRLTLLRATLASLISSLLLFSNMPQHLFSLPQTITKARAGVGDVGIFADTNGGITATTSFVKFPFEGSGNEVRNDGIYTYNAGTDDVTVNETGNYLILSYIRYEDTSNSRTNWQARIAHNDSPVAGSWSYGFVRSSNNNEGFVRGAGMILNATDGDEVALEWRRDDDSGAGGTVAGASTLTLLKLPDDADTSYGHYGTPTTSTFSGTNWIDMTGLDAIRETDTSVIELQSGGDNIRLKPANTTFLIIYGIPFNDGSGNNRTQRIGRAVSGSTEIPQSNSYGYLRNSANEYSALYSMFLYRTTSANEDISIQAQRGLADHDGAMTMMNGSGEAGVFIMELPQTAEVFISSDGSGNQDVGGVATVDLNLMRTVVYNDADSFTKESGDATMQVEQDMDILLTASCRIERTGTSGTRMLTGARFEIEGVDADRGRHGTYLRGNQASTDTYNASLNPAGVFQVTANDSVQVEAFDAGDNGSTDYTVGGSCGFGALNINSLAQDSIVSVSVTSDGTISYGLVAPGESEDTISLSDTQTIENDGNVTQDFNIQGQHTACPWTLAGSAGVDQYQHQFSTNNGSDWTSLTTNYQTLATGISQSGTVSLDLRITVPTTTSCYAEQEADVTIQVLEA